MSRIAHKDLAGLSVDDLMTRDAVVCGPDTMICDAAALMAARQVSSVCIVDNGRFRGIVTVRDMNARVVAGGLGTDAPVAQVMTPDPLTLPPEALGLDVLHMMMERKIGHVPIVKNAQLLGIVTQTDLTRFHALSSGELVRCVAEAPDVGAMAQATARIPALLAQLVGSGTRHDRITRLLSDITDTVTRRLLKMAEARLGPAPAPYVWLACGSQGRQEQTGVSDQDNCLMLADDVSKDDMPYFSTLAQSVCEGLNACGYVFCPGDMMATNPRWCQPVSVWRSYFADWIAKPNPEAQMLASVMFDLRPIGGDETLFHGLQADTLAQASDNSIFVAHLVSNALKHAPPLGMFNRLSRKSMDLKHGGVVPIVDLGRIHAIQGQVSAVNTRRRLEEAVANATLSPSGGADLLDAYDMIATTRLRRQARQIRAGETPDNILPHGALSGFERANLRHAFAIVKTMQSTLGTGEGALG